MWTTFEKLLDGFRNYVMISKVDYFFGLNMGKAMALVQVNIKPIAVLVVSVLGIILPLLIAMAKLMFKR